MHDLPKTNPKLQPFDWHFEAVPKEELLACCYWEYARESAFIQRTLQQYRDWCHAKDGLGYAGSNLDRDFGKIQAMGFPSLVFIRGCAFPREEQSPSVIQNQLAEQHQNHYPITGNFPDPWQSLSEAERKYRSHIRSDIEQCDIKPIRMAHWSLGKDIMKFCEAKVKEQVNAHQRWEREFQRKDERGHVVIMEVAPAAPSLKPPRPGLKYAFGEVMLVQIAWETFTDDEIAEDFREWIKSVRPPDVPKPDRRGREKWRDLRAKLRDLGVMRLMHYATVAGMKVRYPEAALHLSKWKSKHWSAARNRALRNYRELLPTLPEDDIPLHKATKGGRAK